MALRHGTGRKPLKAFRRSYPYRNAMSITLSSVSFQIQRRPVQSSVPDILPDTYPVSEEPPLKKERGKMHPIRHPAHGCRGRCYFHIIDGCTNAGKSHSIRRILRPLMGSLYLIKRKSSCHFPARICPASYPREETRPETFMTSGKTCNAALFQSRASHKTGDRKSHRLPLLPKLSHGKMLPKEVRRQFPFPRQPGIVQTGST